MQKNNLFVQKMGQNQAKNNNFEQKIAVLIQFSIYLYGVNPWGGYA